MKKQEYLNAAKELGWEISENDGSVTKMGDKIILKKKIGPKNAERVFVHPDFIEFDVWEAIRKMNEKTRSEHKAVLELGKKLRQLSLERWTMTDPDCHQMRCKRPGSGDEYMFYEVRAWNNTYRMASDLIVLSECSKEEIEMALSQFDGILDDVIKGDDEMRDALIAEALFESRPVSLVGSDFCSNDFDVIARCIDQEIEEFRWEPEEDEGDWEVMPHTEIAGEIVWTGEPDIEMQLDEMFGEDSDEQLPDDMKIRVISEVMNRMDWEQLIEDSIALGNERIVSLIREVLSEQKDRIDPEQFILKRCGATRHDSALFGPDGHEEYHHWFDVPLSYLNGKYPDAKQAEVEISFPADTKRENILTAATTAIAPVYENEDGLYSGDWEEYDMSIELLAKVLIKNNII